MDSKLEPRVIVCLILGLILTIWAYYPGLSGPFTFDDHHNIADNNFLKIEHFSFEELWQASLSSDSGPLKRPVSMFSFAVNHLFTEMDPWWMKLTNLFIHLLNGFLVLLLMKSLFYRFHGRGRFGAVLAPYFIAGLWLVHPINVTAVSYIVQRMTSLSATFVLLALYCYLKLRERKPPPGWRSYLLSISIMLFWLLGLLSKETAILLSIYIFAIEWCVYGFKTDSNIEKIQLRIVWGLFAAPWVCALLYIIYDPSYILNGYGSRNFTITERVLTEFRIVSEYIRLIILPDVGDMGFFQDDIELSTSLWSPLSTLFGVVFLVSLFILAISVRKRNALLSLGLLWFLGGHLLESTVFPIELMFLHRNYLPSVGLLLIVGDIVIQFSEHHRRLVTVGAVLLLVGLSINTRSLSYQWSGDLRMFLMEVINNPDSVRANFRAGQVYKAYAVTAPLGVQRNDYKDKAIEHFNKIKKIDPYDNTGELCILETYIQMDEVPPRWLIEDLIIELPHTNINRGVIHLFKSYLQCLINKGCLLTPEDFERMLAALSSNHYIRADSKRLILLIKAEYNYQFKNNINDAITAVLEAIQWQGHLDDFVLLAKYYESGEYYEQMRRTITYLEENDTLGKHKKFINDFKAKTFTENVRN
jgi:protein O-mannosyl-transferase